MDDALVVRGFERLGDLSRDSSALSSSGSAPVDDAIGERRALDQLEHQRARHAAESLEPVDRRDVRMIERGEDSRFALEARQPIGIAGEVERQDLERDVAIRAVVSRAR